jgi:choline dehydrogenase
VIGISLIRRLVRGSGGKSPTSSLELQWMLIALFSGREMRKYFENIEHNNYLKPGTPGHGFMGWLQTNIADRATWARAPHLKVFQAGLKLIGWDPEKAVDYLTGDANYLDPKRDQTEGLWALPFHVTPRWKRFSPRDYILETLNVKNGNGTQKYPLHLQLESLATKVLFDTCSGGNGTKPRAIGVEYLQGRSVYKADPRHNSSATGTFRRAYARKEVIVSGGTFSSPQLLQLSGIGPASLLLKHNIPVISNLPGVGRNLQDNYEIPVYGNAQVSLVETPDPNAPVCTYGAPGDPCVTLWQNGTGPYARGGSNSNVFLLKTPHAVEHERDMLMFGFGGSVFRGFAPTTSQNQTFVPPSTFSWSTVKMHPQNTAGYVQIRSSDPTEMPEVNMNYFAEGKETDMAAILDTVAFVRRAFAATEGGVGPVVPVSPPCPVSQISETGYCHDKEIDEEWIKDQVFGHHPTSTNKVGPDDDAMAVLDTRLRVRGVKGLRVVDASAFPRCPGAFPAVATFMLSERATGLVLQDVEKW